MDALTFDRIYEVLAILGKSTDDYLLIYDLNRDEYAISENAVTRFKIDYTRSFGATTILERVCFPADYPLFQESIKELVEGKKVNYNLEFRWLDKNSVPVWVNCRGQVIEDEDEDIKYLVGRIMELGRRNVVDNVTGLYREMKLLSDLSEMQKHDPTCGYLLQLGIDNFRELNDKHGKAFGDEMLQMVTNCIKSVVDNTGVIYRMEGDEICVLITDVLEEDSDAPVQLYRRIRRHLDKVISQTDYQHFCTISAGSVYFDRDFLDVEVLLERAEFALHLAKQNGKNCYAPYCQADYDTFVKRLDMQEALRKSVMNNFSGFELYYQPIVNIKERKILGAEALLRWKNESFGCVSPVEFIPLLEDSGLIIPVGRWIIDEGLHQCKKWKNVDERFRININLSFIQLKKSNVLGDIDESMKKLDFKSRNVLFEVTESGELEEGSITKRILESFQRRNLALGIDDFGTGYSNLRYIKEMMFDLVKIDREFIKDITRNRYDYLVVKQFTELAHSLNLRVCYEGVETDEDLRCVLQLDPDYIQGYYFGKPVTAEEFEKNYLAKTIELGKEVIA